MQPRVEPADAGRIEAAGPFRAATVAPSLLAAELTRSFQHRLVLSDLNLRVEPAEVLVVTGPNGSGKSTLLKLLAGLLRPTRGRVWLELEGRPLSDERRRAETGYAAPDVRPYEELSAAENIKLMGQIRGIPKIRGLIPEILAGVGLDPAGRAPAGSLSTGQRQRLKLALAGLGKPAMLLLDEPGANLDADGRAIVARLVQEARRRGPVVLATNDPEEAQLGDRELRLERLAGSHDRRS